jgi:uncharacterized integral membrane protein (TIGR00698 family)
MLPHAVTNPEIDTVPGREPNPWEGAVNRLPGVALVSTLAITAIELGKIGWLQRNGISALTVAIVLGMIAGNTLYPRIASASSSGVTFSKQTLLRAGIILYGLRLTFQDIANVGIAGVAIDACVLSSTFALSWWAGTRILGLDRRTAMLIGAGSSICGAAAIMAAEPVVGGRPAQVAVAVSTVVVFGTLAIFLYPALYHLIEHFPALAMSPRAYGIFTGSTVHEVAQVVAAGRAVSDTAANAAVITKMVRVMMLAPFLVILSAYLSRSPDPRSPDRSEKIPSDKTQSVGRIVIPWFALGFVAVTALNSLAVLPKTAVSAAVNLDTVILAMAMAALGVTTQVSAIRTAGFKPLALAALLFAWLVFGGAAINAAVGVLFV